MPVWLKVVEGPGAGAELELGEAVVIGRDPEADLSLDDPGVSRRHAELRAEGPAAVVEDLGSSNGTFVNGERISSPQRLRSGDQVYIGSSTITIDAGTAETEQIAAGPDPTEVAPAPLAPPPRRPPPPERRPIEPRPLEPQPAAQPEAMNWPAIAAVVIGPLSILLLVAGSGAAFYAALPFGIAAIALASVGKRRAAGGAGMRGLAVAGQVAGVIGTILATLAILVLIAVGVATDIAADNLADLIDEVEAEIRNEVDSQVP